MSNRITPERLKEIKERCEQATPGPWVVGVKFYEAGVNDGSHEGWNPPERIKPGECVLCHVGEPVEKGRDERGRSYHVHRVETYDWHSIVSDSTREEITGNYDFEEGGVCSKPEDAEFIAHAREDVPALVAEVERLHGLFNELRKRIGHWRLEARNLMRDAEDASDAEDKDWLYGRAEGLEYAADQLEGILNKWEEGTG